MTRGLCGVALVFAIGATSVAAGRPMQNEWISDAKKWRNPILVIRAVGVEVISKSLPSGSRTVAPTDLRRMLIYLPVAAWPYGRVAAVQDVGLHPADLTDGPVIADNRTLTLAVLETLGVTAEQWPSP